MPSWVFPFLLSHLNDRIRKWSVAALDSRMTSHHYIAIFSHHIIHKVRGLWPKIKITMTSDPSQYLYRASQGTVLINVTLVVTSYEGISLADINVNNGKK